MLLGAHMSIAGGVDHALQRGAEVGCETVQIFTRNQLRWHSRPLDAAETARFRDLAAGFAAVLAHASYLINLASPDAGLRERSASALAEELQRCSALGIRMLVLHPGAHGGAGLAQGCRRVRDGALRAYEMAGAPAVRLLLETTTGTGTTLGGSFAELRDLLGEVSEAGVPAGVCLDTCHVFAAGYELRDAVGYSDTWQRFDTLIGRSRLGAVHLNDSRDALGSRLDHHAHIGRGQIGASGFALLVNDRTLAHTPGILETPKGRTMSEDVENLGILRGLTGAPASAPPPA
ncbi:MAG: deoxyribonuclease IV [Spirochaetales bacterium]|nr:deoxyribonuclease IV [Spirochaetales bacterium]